MEPIIIFDDDQEQAAHAAAMKQQHAEPETTGRPRRASRKTEEPDAQAAALAGAAPKKRRSRTSKKAAADIPPLSSVPEGTEQTEKISLPASPVANEKHDRNESLASSDAGPSADSESASVPSVKPRRPRSRKTSVTVPQAGASSSKDTEPALVPETLQPSSQDEKAAAKKGRRKKSAEGDNGDKSAQGVLPVSEDSLAAPEGQRLPSSDVSAKPRRSRSRKASAMPAESPAVVFSGGTDQEVVSDVKREDSLLARQETVPVAGDGESSSSSVPVSGRRPATIEPFALQPSAGAAEAVASSAPALVSAGSEAELDGALERAAEAENPDSVPHRRRGHRGGRGRRKHSAVSDNAAQTGGAVEQEASTPAGVERGKEDAGVIGKDSGEASFAGKDDDTAQGAESSAQDVAEQAVTAESNGEELPSQNRPRSRSARRRAAAARRKAEARAAAEGEQGPGETSASEQDDAPAKKGSEAAASGSKKIMLVSVLPGELVEVAILEGATVAEYYVEMVHQAKIRGNIYKGVVSNIDPNLQAAFVNFGQAKNGFLQIDEVHPEYWLTHYDPEKGAKYPPIQKVMKAGQEVLVQVVKEPAGTKGAFLTTWVSLAGRFLVLTPGQEQIGISRKVEDGEERNRLRELIKDLKPGEGLGAIVRTVSAGTSKTTLQHDLSYLKRVWKGIHKRAGTDKAPSLLYEEPGLASRAVRDYLSDDVAEVWVDDPATADSMREMVAMLFPRRADMVKLYDNPTKSLWEQFNVRKQLEQVHSREVTLPSGGRLVFDQTEALMAVDINSGKSGGKTNFESTAARTNLEAAEAIARQLRLRDVGGQVVIDFIEMRDQSKCHEVEKVLRNAMKYDRARHDIGHMSSFGLLQIVRQRIGSSAISISQEPCPHCGGTGMRRNMEWQALQLLREFRGQMNAAARNGQHEYVCSLEPELAVYVLNAKRERLSALEKEFGVRLEIRINPSGDAR